jgi:hypothetical protein
VTTGPLSSELLWPATFVAESNLPPLVNELRKALRDSAIRSRFIRTVPRFGYAFCGDIVESPPSRAAAVGGPSCWLILDSGRIELVQGENVIGRDRTPRPGSTSPPSRAATHGS